ncbi:MAG: HAMP domain-containing histidine kinase [Myxococcales bacterium]|nr:HAMP domain-containing histidine kinase [Myxococcales bacterium]
MTRVRKALTAVRFPPANIQLRRAQLVLILVVLVPTVLLEVVGVLLTALGDGGLSVVLGILVLTLCTTGITGYVLGSIFVNKGASLARIQNDYVSSVSHELRTPLTSIRLLIEGLASDKLANEEKQHVLKLLGQETDRLEKLVVRVLELSRIESGAQSLHQDEVLISDVVADAMTTFNAATIGTPQPIRIELEPDLVVVGDRETLARAIANLLINAWKYSGDQKDIAIVGARARRWVELAVIDNGPGIARDEQGMVFEQFARGRSAEHHPSTGYGLGLAFVRAIVRAHRGKIDVNSRPGRTEMKLRLRPPRKPRPPATTSQAAVAGPATTRSSHS